ncbi:MAG: complex I NDUFA9 subunit family protein [Pseudomonadota bacterium]
MPVRSVCVLGGSGFVGTELVCRLANLDYDVTVLTRNKMHTHHLSVLPNVKRVEADVHDSAALTAQLRGTDAVINLIGILNESRSAQQRFDAAHHDLAHTLASVCKANGVERLLQMSALNADEDGSSEYLRSKGRAETALRAAAGDDLRVSFFQPSVIFGPNDSFFNRFAGLLKMMPVFPLACPNARFAPVYVGDVVNVFCADLDVDDDNTPTYPLCGPNEYSLHELVRYTAETLGLTRAIIDLPDIAARAQALVMGLLPGKPFSYDNYLSLQTDSVCTENCEAQPTAIEHIVPDYLFDSPKQSTLQRMREQARR